MAVRRGDEKKFIEVDGTKIRFSKGAGVHEVEVPKEVGEFAEAAIDLIYELIFKTPFGKRLKHPGAARSLVLYLYAKWKGLPPYRIAKQFGVSHEQLYRMERALKKDGLYEEVLSKLEAVKK